jgi:hypothetical protein
MRTIPPVTYQFDCNQFRSIGGKAAGLCLLSLHDLPIPATAIVEQGEAVTQFMLESAILFIRASCAKPTCEFVVRSSSSKEDSANASSAGKYKSIRCSSANVLNAISEVREHA